MIQIDMIRNFFPAWMRDDARFKKFMLMEYVQLMILDYLSATPWIRNLTFIGGTSLRLAKGIDRFSEDLDFDCKDFTRVEFMEMTDGVIRFLNRQGLPAISKEKENPDLKAFRRILFFPGLLYDMGLSNHREERFLVKVECQEQGVKYQNVMAYIKGCGFIFPLPMPTDQVLCAMKLAAMVDRHKGRDFYDVIFLLSQSLPDFQFLNQKCGIADMKELKTKFETLIANIDLRLKMKDFEHLLINKENSTRILQVAEFFRSL